MNTTASAPPPPPQAPVTPAAVPDVPAPTKRLLRRSTSDRVVAGVCGGLADYLGMDPAIIRILAVVLTLGGGSGVLLYLIAWIAIPEENGSTGGSGSPGGRAGAAGDRSAHGAGDRAPMIFGALLIGVGGLVLLDRILPDVGWLLWPVGLVAAGVLLILGEVRR